MEGRRIPIILVTAVLDEQIRNQVLEAGAVDVQSKPFSDERLASCLVSALNGSMNTLPSLAGMPSLSLK